MKIQSTTYLGGTIVENAVKEVDFRRFTGVCVRFLHCNLPIPLVNLDAVLRSLCDFLLAHRPAPATKLSMMRSTQTLAWYHSRRGRAINDQLIVVFLLIKTWLAKQSELSIFSVLQFLVNCRLWLCNARNLPNDNSHIFDRWRLFLLCSFLQKCKVSFGATFFTCSHLLAWLSVLFIAQFKRCCLLL